jgi:hypothetical protein
MTNDEAVSGEQPAAVLVPTVTPARSAEHVDAIAASGHVALMNSEYARALRGERAMAGDTAER